MTLFATTLNSLFMLILTTSAFSFHERGDFRLAAATPLLMQAKNYTCGAAALRSVLMSYSDEIYEDYLEKDLASDPQHGTSFRKMLSFTKELNKFMEPGRKLDYHPWKDRHVFGRFHQPYQTLLFSGISDKQPITANHIEDLLKKNFSETFHESNQGLTADSLKTLLSKKIPVIVLVQAWPAEQTLDWEKSDENGHYVVATGFDDQNFYFMDPELPGRYGTLSNEDFLKRWHDVDKDDGKVQHFGLAIFRSEKNDYLSPGFAKIR